MVYTQDRVLQRFMEQIIVFLQRLLSRTSTFQLHVVRLTIFIKILSLQLVLQVCWKQQINGFFALFPVGKKVRRSRVPRVGTGRGGLRELSWWSCWLAPALMAARASWVTTWDEAAYMVLVAHAYWRVRFLSGPPSC